LAGGLFIGDFYQSGTSFINLGSGTFYTNLPILNGGTLLAGTFFDQNLLNQGTASYISVGTLIIAANAATFSGTVTANYLSIASPSVHTLGTIFQNGALMNIGSLDIGSIGTLSMSAGTTNVTALNSAGTIAISGGKLALTAPNTAPAGTISAISISGTGVLDVGSSGIVIEYGSGTSPAGDLPYVANSGPRNYPTGSLQRAAQTGFNNYAWNGSGIISSYAANDSSGLTAVGIVDENDLGIYPNDYTTAGGGPGSWMGQPITDTNNVLVRMTWYGDGNDDGVVNKFDVAALAQGYSGLAGYIGWSDGDYTYAGSITRQDVSLLAQSYVFQGAPLGDAITPQQAQYLLALDPTMPANLAAAFEAIATPEPMSVGLLGTAGLLALTKRRRHSSI
jgi:hypothetical protein